MKSSAAPILRVRGAPNVFTLLDHERCISPGVCGNKARKLLSMQGALAPGAHVVSHGGAQSNAMLALAHLCRAHDGVTFTYHSKPLPAWLRKQPTGNLRRALHLGMRLREHASAAEYEAACAAARESRDTEALFVPQGAAWPGAEAGVVGLAEEIGAWWQPQSTPLSVVVPAGTGTTALFLARHAPPNVMVYAVPCVGGTEGLLQQMHDLDAASGGAGVLPRVLPPPGALTTPFAKPSAAVLGCWREAAASHGLLLDLVYGAIAWGTLAACGFVPGRARTARGATATTLYVHCGGLEGLDTSLRRYQRLGLLREGETAETALSEAHNHLAARTADVT